MSIPLAYNLRNLVVRKTTTIMTALGIALTVAVLLAILALVAGLRSTLSVSGDPLHVLVLRKGSDSELVSVFLRSQFQDLKFKSGIALGRDGQPLASMEVVTIMILEGADRSEGSNLTVRGIPPAGIEMRRNVHLVRGRWFQPGQREVVVGKAIADRFPQAQIGRKVHFGRGDWEIAGVFDASGGAQSSEVWGDLFQVSSDLQRVDAVSSGLVTATDPITAKALVASLNEDQRLGVKAMLEKDYYDQQTSSAKPIESVGLIVAIIMAIGSSFAAMNTMYAAVARRSREIGTLRVLGFSKGSILASFLVESTLLSGLGGLLGCVLAMPLNGITTAIGNNTFSETAFAFHVTPQIMLTGIIFAVVLGSGGGLFPARMAARKQILTALREG
ncbi:MAG TPA: ABC transporter permease [Bryobacteraceae bacterium]|nr:ABC transporter permease [Bryobacteraceae bacterium]